MCQDSLRALPLEEEEQGVELCPRFAMGRIDGEDRLKLFDRLGKLFQGGQDHGFVQTRLQVSGIKGQNLIDMVKGFFPPSNYCWLFLRTLVLVPTITTATRS